MDDHVVKLTETLYSNSRITLDFFMHMPEGVWTNTDHDGIRFNHYPMVVIRCKDNKDIFEYDFKKASFRVTVRNHYDIIRFFNKIMKWFYDDKYSDLFMIGGNNKIMFNADYKSLHTTTSLQIYDNNIMTAVPSIVDYDGKLYEGINLFINITDYRIPLTFMEVGIIFGIVSNFNFSSEVTKMLSMYEYVIRHDQVRNPELERTPFD